MNGGHGRFLNADSPSQNLHDGRDTICRAACAADQPGRALRRVDAVDHAGDFAAFFRCGEDDPPGSCLQVLLHAVFCSENAGTFKDRIDF